MITLPLFNNSVLVYVFSLIAALETFGWNRILLIAMIIFATMLTIHGELNFSWTGSLVQVRGHEVPGRMYKKCIMGSEFVCHIVNSLNNRYVEES